MISAFCALATAALFFLAHGTADVGLLAWLAPIPIIWLAFGREPSWRVAIAAAVGYALGQLGMLWPYYDAMGLGVLGAAVGPAVVFATFALLARLASRRLTANWAVLVFPCLWTGWEALFALLFPHGSFGAWACTQVRFPVLIQGASLLGLWIVTFTIALFATGVALTIRRRTAAPLAIASMLLLANVAFGVVRLRQPNGAIIRVAAVAQDHDDHATPEQVAIAEAVEVRRAARQGAAVVVFPEKAALVPEQRRDSVLSPLLAAARETKTLVVAGFDQTGAQRRNSAYAIARDGLVTSYTKRHHIPGLERNYVVGDGPGLLGHGMAMAICKDLDFQRTMRGDAIAAANQGGLGLLLVPAWDFDADAWLHARMAILRGVEGGYAIVRAAANGLVTVSDAQGRVHSARSGADRFAALVTDVPSGTGSTLYLRIGDAFAWIAGALGILLVAWSVARAN
jgi:apolipoprotein N-acyltransferase